MSEVKYDLVVIGSGPGGYVCALRASQLGLRVACVEKDATLGGTCLNVGCIPSKALLESTERLAAIQHEAAVHGIEVDGVRPNLATMMARKSDIVAGLTSGVAQLLKKNQVTHLQGLGRVIDGETVGVRDSDGVEQRVTTASIVIATGSHPAALPGVTYDGDRIGTSTEALTYESVPDHLVVIGAGVIGLELGSVWARLGARVTVMEYMDRILPGADAEVARETRKILARQGLEFVLSAKVTGADVDGDTVQVRWEDASGETNSLQADRVLVAIGRRPHTEGLGCEDAGITLDEAGRVVVDANGQTSLQGVWAIGDVTTGPMLAHKAEEEGIAVAERLAGGHGHVDYDAIPYIVYTHPEVAWVGPSEESLKADQVPYAKGRFPYAANGRALALGERHGLVKILAHAETDRILACHIVGARAGDLIAEMVLAVTFGASAEDVARSVHAHPTLSEVLREAALDVDRRALHK